MRTRHIPGFSRPAAALTAPRTSAALGLLMTLLLVMPASAAVELPTPRPTAVAAAPSGPGASNEAGGAATAHRLSAGTAHTCLALPNGDVQCWGRGLGGPLGSGRFISTTTPTTVNLIHDATSVELGDAFSCAVRATGSVACWGSQSFGETGGPASGDPALEPVAVPGVSNGVQVAAGRQHACALIGNGTIWCWGAGSSGQLGRVIGGPVGPPALVPGISGAVAVAAGVDFTCALLADGTVRCWGMDDVGQLGNATPNGAVSTATPVPVLDSAGHALTGVKAIGLGRGFGCAIFAGGTAACWGRNDTGQLGNGATLPGQVVSHAVSVVGLTGATGIAAGDGFACAAVATGAIRCWGKAAEGELGPAVSTASSSPVTVVGVAGAVEVAVGSQHACARLAADTVSCWGYNGSRALGRPTNGLLDNPPAAVVGNFTGARIVAGGFHTCVLLASRSVQCWGEDNSGQLGNGSASNVASATPLIVSGLSNVVSISAGTAHTCAIVVGGQAYCWGLNDHGQIGNGDLGAGKHVDAPVAVTGLTDAIAISAGGNHTCAVRANFTVVCWGGNEHHQLGNLGTADVPIPWQVISPAYPIASFLTDIVAVSAGSGHTCATDRDGSAWCWGDNGTGQLGNGLTGSANGLPQRVKLSTAANDYVFDAVDVVARYTSSCLTAGWQVLCWGWNAYGELGLGGGGDKNVAAPVPGLASVAGMGPSSNHGVHVCAVRSDLTVMCWGANDKGQDGTGAISPQESSPSLVTGLTGAIQVSVGFQHSCALVSNGTVKCWGSNVNKQLGSSVADPDPTPTLVTGFNVGARAVEIEAGAAHTCAVAANATARCWGSNGSGRLGDGTTTTRSKPGVVSGLSGAAAVSAGGAHTCALLSSGGAKCWGANAYGQLGDKTVTSRKAPVTVLGLTSIIAISAGGNHSCALISNGTVKCWGLNSSGQLGDGTTTSRHSPVTVKTSSTTALTGVIAISAGTSHTCALLANGTARCWGAGGNGRLGTGSTSSRRYATPVSGVTSTTAAASRFASISAGGAHTCARLANGTAKCWGAGGSGRLGNASTADHSTPVTVSSLSSVVQISAGGAHTCALLSDGAAKCWGSNASGQLGINSTTSKSTPVTVSGLSGATSISAGGNHTGAELAGGGLRAWGLNSSGQVGDGTTTKRLTPHGVAGF